jgi:hypothetical protein
MHGHTIVKVGFQNSQTTRNILHLIFCFIFHFSILVSLPRDQRVWQYFLFHLHRKTELEPISNTALAFK